MIRIPFRKLQGTGNDFIVIDNRAGLVPAERMADFARRWCPRGTAVGADGAIFLENDPEFDFRWRFYNADGSEAEMCGNGARCIAVFAHAIGAAGESMRFRTLAGEIGAHIVPDGARVTMGTAKAPVLAPDLALPAPLKDLWFINTGVPHAVIPTDDLENVDIRGVGAFVRYHAHFAPAGTNVNVMRRDGDILAVRTYERGVEDETLACGTGSIACAIVAGRLYGMTSPVTVRTRSGQNLRIRFHDGGDTIRDIELGGPVETVYHGELEW